MANKGIGPVTLGLAVDAESHVGLEVRAFGLAARLGGDARRVTLLLRGERVIIGPAGDIMEALVGVRLDPARLLAILSGCIAVEDVPRAAARVDSFIQVTLGDDIVYLAQEPSGWVPRAGVFDRLVVEYRRMAAGYASQIAISSEPGRSPAIALVITVRELDINPVFTGQEFTLVVPPAAESVTIEDLRASGPLGQND